ncbi:hypothetical protein RB195_015909 [Necator americanus]|uniref:Uncharacterized protein n=1 Tax=Necator americanus TaxID=51031 RepID=A0ABR1E7C1_NECAM
MRPHVHFNSESFDLYEDVSGLYNDLLWLADVSSQCFYPPRQVWYDFIEPEGMKGLVSTRADSNLGSIVLEAEPLTATLHPPATEILPQEQVKTKFITSQINLIALLDYEELQSLERFQTDNEEFVAERRE